MSEFFKAELKDKFLEYALGRDDYFQTQLLYDEFLRPNYDLQFVEKLIKEIIEQDANLLDIMSGNGVKIFMLSSTAHTGPFLEEGGFKDLYINEEEKWDTFLDQLANTRKLSSAEKERLGRKEKTSYKRERTLLFILIAAVAASFLFTLFSLLNTIFSEPDYISEEEFQQRIEQLKLENENENESLRAELQRLKNQLKPLKQDSIKR